MSVYCRECKLEKNWRSFLDDEGNVSTRCEECRKKSTTGAQTPYAKRASGKISVEEVKRLLEAKEKEKK